MDDKIFELETELLQTLSPEQAWYFKVLPKANTTEYSEFYYDEETDPLTLLEELETLLGKKIRLCKIPSIILSRNLSKHYLKIKNIKDSNNETFIEDSPNLNSSNDFLFFLIKEANELLCSDIHIEAYEYDARIRFRIDGKLFERFILKKEDYPSLINKIKILSNLDIAEKRLPQDGRTIFQNGVKSFDIRVSIIPSLFGEKIVLRLLRKSASEIDICKLGFSNGQLRDYLEGIKRPNGIVLISGPTGSGKTTTLYATLNLLNKKDINILTIEDPIEYTLNGINQVQLREDIGLTFARALKTFLRQDPDIIMLGEIRDQETAQMAIRAALTGHLVLSTIHTNSAWGIITRLIDMGVPPFLISSTINTAVAQRLIRKLCPHCKTETDFDISLLPANYVKQSSLKTHFIPVGCEQCHNSGYSGRLAFFEVILIDNELRDCIRQNNFNMDKIIKTKETSTLSSKAYELFSKGITSFEEVLPILLCD